MQTSVRFRKGDFVAIGIVIAMILLVLIFFPKGSEKAETVLIYQDGVLIAEYPLQEDAEFTVQGDYTNVVVISGGKAAVTESDCPGEDCVHTGWIYRSGRNIVCLPNRVEIRISGKSDADIIVG